MTKPAQQTGQVTGRKFTPANCPHCEYDRKFPETGNGGWVYMGNNGPIGPCPMCNPDGSHPRAASEASHG